LAPKGREELAGDRGVAGAVSRRELFRRAGGAGLLLVLPGAARAARLPPAAGVREDGVVLRWNAAALEGVRSSRLGPPMVARALAIVHTSAYDAWAAHDRIAVGPVSAALSVCRPGSAPSRTRTRRSALLRTVPPSTSSPAAREASSIRSWPPGQVLWTFGFAGLAFLRSKWSDPLFSKERVKGGRLAGQDNLPICRTS
jgi:hypothetical protein